MNLEELLKNRFIRRIRVDKKIVRKTFEIAKKGFKDI